MKTEVNAAPFFDAERVEQVSTLSLVAGLLLVFQWGYSWLFPVGLALLAIGTIGTLAGQVIQKTYVARILERMMVVGMMVGIVGMLQAWQIWFYENGFYILGISTLGFIIVSHIGSPEE